MTLKLVYMGSVPATFVGIDRELQPGDTFTVPRDLAESFLGRSDIEVAAPEPDPAPVKTKKATQPEPASDPT